MITDNASLTARLATLDQLIETKLPLFLDPVPSRETLRNWFDAAVTLYRVGTVKKLPGLRCYVAVDGGMSDNPRPVLYGSGYEAFLPRSPRASRPLAARLVGKHCESGDVIVDDARLPSDLVVGDVLATPVTGAYGFAMSSNYNRVLRPPVVFVSGGRYRVGVSSV